MGATAIFLLNKQVSTNLIYVSIICLSVVIAAVTYELLLMASKKLLQTAGVKNTTKRSLRDIKLQYSC